MPEFKHFSLQGTASSEPFTAIGGGGAADSPPPPDRTLHGNSLLNQLAVAERNATESLKLTPPGRGLQFIPLEFVENSDFGMQLDRLESENKGIRVLNVRSKNDKRHYLVAVPNSEVEYFAKRFREYMTKDSRHGSPKNEPLASGIAEIIAGELTDYWTDAHPTLPDAEEQFWWEVWLHDDRSTDVATWFREIAVGQGLQVSDQSVRFPERVVVLAFARLRDWQAFPGLLQKLAEFRRANIVTAEFIALPPSDQSQYIEDLLGRLQFAGKDAPAVSVLDTGVNRGHPLLAPALTEQDSQAWRQDWGPADLRGHGTEVAGLALYGDIGDLLLSKDPCVLTHCLESVKILPNTGDNSPPDYGPITVGSMAMAEQRAPARRRIFCMAVTGPSSEEAWLPSLWSATIDKACAGMDDGHQRLLIISAGNLRDQVGHHYPDENQLSSVEDPAQSWNALTVGAHTDKVWPEDEMLDGYEVIAPRGGLSPASRTSLSWGERNWPFKPDVVFEGGNYVKDVAGNVTTADNLQVLTTQLHPPSDALLGTSKDTSAAAAQVARIAAVLQAEYPDFWPETIRGLLVHSAEWTPRMLEEYQQQARQNRLRIYGWGVPDLQRARDSAQGVATMVIQEELQPFRLDGNKGKTNDFHLHSLPLPQQVLLDLGSTPVRMRVTLSYFIEPNPSRRGWAARYRYASHGLRFDVKRPGERREEMINRLSQASWPAANRKSRKRPHPAVKDNREWDLKAHLKTRGSLHSDFWVGTAADLATSDLIAIYPIMGWWGEQPNLGFVGKRARYSLVVTISTDAKDVELYQAIDDEIAIRARALATIKSASQLGDE